MRLQLCSILGEEDELGGSESCVDGSALWSGDGQTNDDANILARWAQQRLLNDAILTTEAKQSAVCVATTRCV